MTTKDSLIKRKYTCVFGADKMDLRDVVCPPPLQVSHQSCVGVIVRVYFQNLHYGFTLNALSHKKVYCAKMTFCCPISFRRLHCCHIGVMLMKNYQVFISFNLQSIVFLHERPYSLWKTSVLFPFVLSPKCFWGT